MEKLTADQARTCVADTLKTHVLCGAIWKHKLGIQFVNIWVRNANAHCECLYSLNFTGVELTIHSLRHRLDPVATAIATAIGISQWQFTKIFSASGRGRAPTAASQDQGSSQASESQF